MGSKHKNQMSGYIALANAVIRQAAKDYRDALRMLRRRPTDGRALMVKRDSEKFFKSGWFMQLTNINGVWLMEAIRKEYGYHEDQGVFEEGKTPKRQGRSNTGDAG